MTSENHEIIDTLAGMRKTAEEAREALDAVSADLGEQGRPEGDRRCRYPARSGRPPSRGVRRTLPSPRCRGVALPGVLRGPGPYNELSCADSYPGGRRSL
jgi:hypothetical protein